MAVLEINPQDWIDALHASGYRVTAGQSTVVDIFAQSDRPLSANQAWKAARRMLPEIGRATVYRAIDKLELLGLLRRVHGVYGCSRFTPAGSEAMMLFICVRCGRAEYLDRSGLNQLIAETEQASGHQIVGSWLQLYGTCAQCQKIG